jgi:hypothetical protein
MIKEVFCASATHVFSVLTGKEKGNRRENNQFLDSSSSCSQLLPPTPLCQPGRRRRRLCRADRLALVALHHWFAELVMHSFKRGGREVKLSTRVRCLLKRFANCRRLLGVDAILRNKYCTSNLTSEIVEMFSRSGICMFQALVYN